jgi:hypothetical protein
MSSSDAGRTTSLQPVDRSESAWLREVLTG